MIFEAVVFAVAVAAWAAFVLLVRRSDPWVVRARGPYLVEGRVLYAAPSHVEKLRQEIPEVRSFERFPGLSFSGITVVASPALERR